jgi:hypothetical protein
MKASNPTSGTWTLLTLAAIGLSLVCSQAQTPRLSIMLDATKTFQTVDGFGANINPAQWRDGNLKPALDLLVDDLGGTLFRLDPTGLAKWLDPARRLPDGHYPPEYLEQIYTSKVFRDAWATFRALNAKGAKPFLNASGHVTPGLGRADDPKRLADFEGYAEMVVTMTKWAREREHLEFTMLAPFNETDLGFPEGPKIPLEDTVSAVGAVIRRLDEHGLSDVRLILMDDGGPWRERVNLILKQESWAKRVAVFGFHGYGDGEDGDSAGWSGAYGQMVKAVRSSAYSNSAVWMTEYGDLDQSGLIEHEIGWRSTRRMLRLLNEGLSAGLVWDAFDNLHEHDAAWSTYGLLATDTNSWKYTPKPRFFAAKQVFRFVKPGFVRVAADPERIQNSADPYANWRDPSRHLLVCAFVSPDRKDFSLVGMNRLEVPWELSIDFKGVDGLSLNKPVHCYQSTDKASGHSGAPLAIKNQTVTAEILPRAIFTFSTLK